MGYQDTVTSGGNPSAGFADANSSSGGPLDPKFLARIQCADWRPIAHLPRGLSYDDLVAPPSKRKRRYAGTYTALCPECQQEFTAERAHGGKLTYHPKCGEIVRLRKQRECYAQAAERKGI